MVPFKAMQEPFMPSYCLQVKKRGGMGCIRSQTKCVAIFPMLQPSLTMKQSSSFIGPLVVGLISDLTGNIRFSFFFLVFMVWAAVPLLIHIDAEQGWKDAQEYRYQPLRILAD